MEYQRVHFPREKKNYLNLSNGLLAVERFGLKEYNYIRLQSTACEQKRWDFIIEDLDNGFFMDLALGYEVVVYDFSERWDCTRAVFQGLEWVKYVLERRWFGIHHVPMVRGKNVQEYFALCYDRLGDRAKKKVDYFRKYLTTPVLYLSSVTGRK